MVRNKILVVDDTKELRELLQEVLEMMLPKKEVITSTDGGEGWINVQQNFNSIWLIITDWEMPEMNGIELTKKVKTAFPEIPVILTSGLSTPVENPADAFLSKPFNINDLANLIQSLTT